MKYGDISDSLVIVCKLVANVVVLLHCELVIIRRAQKHIYGASQLS